MNFNGAWPTQNNPGSSGYAQKEVPLVFVAQTPFVSTVSLISSVININIDGIISLTSPTS